jgi:hypothetical protein
MANSVGRNAAPARAGATQPGKRPGSAGGLGVLQIRGSPGKRSRYSARCSAASARAMSIVSSRLHNRDLALDAVVEHLDHAQAGHKAVLLAASVTRVSPTSRLEVSGAWRPP